MIKGFSKNGISRIALGTHLGTFFDEDSKQYVDAISFALCNGISSVDTAINYRGMRSEKDTGIALRELIASGKIKREDICISSKAGLLYGDITAGLNPMKYLKEILEPQGITLQDFCSFDGLYQTLNPAFFEIALENSLKNLGIETIDVHYIHIPEITRAVITEEEFYIRIEKLIKWYEKKVEEGKIRYYGLALELMVEEPEEQKWTFSIEKVHHIANDVSQGNSHLKYFQMPYSILYPYASTVKNQIYEKTKLSIIDVCKKLGFTVVGSMPFAMGDGFEKHTPEELLSFALEGVDAVNIGSRNIDHIKEVLQIYQKYSKEEQNVSFRISKMFNLSESKKMVR